MHIDGECQCQELIGPSLNLDTENLVGMMPANHSQEDVFAKYSDFETSNLSIMY